MSTRNPSNIDVQDCTEFQMHKTMHPMYDQLKKKLVDFTEYRLLRYFSMIDDAQQKTMLIEIIEKYRKGLIAIAWKQGRPIYLDLTREK
jgi:hypothetical protein